MKFRTLIAICALLLAGCKTESTDSTASVDAAARPRVCPDGTTVKGNKSCPTPSTTTTTTPTTTTATEPVASPNGVSGENDIADNFNTSSWLAPAVAEGASPDQVGAFRFTCLPGQLAKDDPLVYPGQPGASHLHQFFGNDGTNANSTYQSLRTTGGSTCTRSTGTSPQRTAYWMPAMLDGVGNAVKPDWMNTYYKELPNSDPGCGSAPDATHVGFCIGMPNGLRFILGYSMSTGSGGPTDTSSVDYWKMGFDCVTTDGLGTSYTGVKHTISDIVATGACPTGAWLRVFLTFPDCWDGQYLDTADHRSHMAYASGALVSGQRACPSDHPYKIPEIAVQAFFTTDANFNAGKWHLSSDEMMPGTTPGATLHMDYWEAWSPTVRNLWQTYCINKHLSCAAGNLGNGQQVNGMQQVGSFPVQAKVPLSSIP